MLIPCYEDSSFGAITSWTGRKLGDLVGSQKEDPLTSLSLSVDSSARWWWWWCWWCVEDTGCALNCKSCGSNGPGHCDRGQCEVGYHLTANDTCEGMKHNVARAKYMLNAFSNKKYVLWSVYLSNAVAFHTLVLKYLTAIVMTLN